MNASAKYLLNSRIDPLFCQVNESNTQWLSGSSSPGRLTGKKRQVPLFGAQMGAIPIHDIWLPFSSFLHFPILLLLFRYLFPPFFSNFFSPISFIFLFCCCFASLFIVAVVGFCWVILCRVRYHQLAERTTIGSSNPLI